MQPWSIKWRKIKDFDVIGITCGLVQQETSLVWVSDVAIAEVEVVPLRCCSQKEEAHPFKQVADQFDLQLLVFSEIRQRQIPYDIIKLG
mmetsp:Transcript_36508/g.84635  ORF Transcript_36508/g.84635 Transcript_36508/m.84635 type:complete len:89 (+) Transcript_36508:58-324(+)